MKIFIIYASSGAGHKRASEAIYKAFQEENASGLDIKILDSLNWTNKFFKWLYPSIYLYSVHYLPSVWGFFYALFDHQKLDYFVSSLRRFLNDINSKKLVQFLKDEKPDVIICTHFFATEVISDMKRKMNFKTKLISVITDFGVHAFWVSRDVDRYVVGTEDTKTDLMKRGIEQDRINVLGIPVDPAFSKKVRRDEMCRKLDIKPGVFTVLIVSGGFGVGPVERLARRISKLNLPDNPLQLLIVCGRNPRLYEDINGIDFDKNNHVQIYGFVENIDELMSVSDIIISKSGGLTVAESLAKDLPMIIVSPIPGQEARNCRLLVRYGASIELNRVSQIDTALFKMTSSPDILNKMKESILGIAKPNSARDVVRMVLNYE